MGLKNIIRLPSIGGKIGGGKKMINDLYQMIGDLHCQDLYVLKNKEHFRNKVTKKLIKNKCGF